MALGALSPGVASVWVDLASPSDGARLKPGPLVWKPDGVAVIPFAEAPGGLRRGDVVLAVDGRNLESWAQALITPGASHPRWQVGQTVGYTVRRKEGVLTVPVTLGRYPLATALAQQWGGVLFAFVFLLVGAFVFVRRPAERAARGLLIAASGVVANVLGGLGLQVGDLVGRTGFWLFQATNIAAYMLFWSATLHFALVFPRPQAILSRAPWILPLGYAAPYPVQAAYIFAMRPRSSTTLEWIGHWNAGGLTVVYLVLVLVALAAGYRAARDPVSRQQVRWVVFAMIASASVALGLGMLPQLALGGPLLDWNAQALVALVVPVAIAVAILRYRLFDIDIVLNRALVYGVLTACSVGIYVLVVGYLGTLFRATSSLAISLVATGLVAVLFRPLLDRLQRVVNRLMYGERDDPYAVLVHLGHRLEATLAPEAVMPTIVESVVQALKVPHVSLWLIENERLRRAAAHGGGPAETVIEDAPAARLLRTAVDALQRDDFDAGGAYRAALDGLGVDLVLPLAHRGDPIGALCLAPRSPGEAFSSADRRLLRGLASQAAAAVNAVRLTAALQASLEELRRSRDRLVAVQEEERRRIQRDLHDGLGPTLASMRLRLEGCMDLAGDRSPDLSRELERLDELVGQATADIRRLVYDLRPPSLDQLGLVETLRQHVERFGRETGIQTHFSSDASLLVSPSAEVTILRVVQEALMNVQRHARASAVDVRLGQQAEWLVVEIQDNGVGLSPNGSTTRGGTGLRSMRERAELLGGVLEVGTGSGGGTNLLIRLPGRQR